MTDGNVEKRPKQKLPLSLRVMSMLTIIGMIVVSGLGEYLGSTIGARWPDLYNYLWHITPSLSHLDLSSFDLEQRFRTMFQIVTMLYGMLAWSGLCVAISALWSMIAGPRVTFDDKPGLEKWRMVVFVIFLILGGAAVVFFGLLPLRSEGFLIRGGILDSAPLWWTRVSILVSACTIGVMAAVYMLTVLMKMRRRTRTA
jgi:hypothetical protein